MSGLFGDDSVMTQPYKVLARKYRPQHFDDLRGQDALVRTLKNAITSGRIAQAYMLTGVRGVGKTTTARIIARAINYVGPDGTGGPTIGPTDDCPVCRSIAEDRCPDVIEIDAASHTGVDNIRDIIDSVRYAPTMARYKVYIIDEVHMLSKQAFNALLKTLEEPPPHVKFIFATTEIRKVPITILSRCQRFDLRRFDDDELQKHLADLCGRENVVAEPDALKLIARAGAGSARDGLSILDQAIALGNGTVQADVVRQMLGLVDQNRLTDLLQAALTGQISTALQVLNDLDRVGGDPLVILDDLLTLTHRLIKARVTDNSDELLPTAKAMLDAQTLPGLSRAWQILLKSYGDVQVAPRPLAAAEMAIIRLGYGSTLPDPSKLMRQLSDGSTVAANAPGPAPTGGSRGEMAVMQITQPVAQAVPVVGPINTMADVVAILEQDGQMILAMSVAHYAAPVKIEPGRIEFVPVDGAPAKLAGDLGAALTAITGTRWIATLARSGGGATHGQNLKHAEDARRDALMRDPMVSAVLLAFPGATVTPIDD